jgi:DNA-binding PadR family transcriptional regulator
MALAHAILALLVRQPMSGYDLNKAFEESVGCFWKATHQQIYRELGKLEDQGWITAETIAQSGRPDKKLYSMTALGHENLTQWIAEPCDVMPIKEELLVKIFAGGLVPKAVIRQQIEQHRQQHQATLDRYRAIEDEISPTAECSPMTRFSYLVLRRGIHYETDYVDWCNEVLVAIEEM